MWGHPADTAQPQDIAYVLGARIVATYYDNAKDKVKAVSEILGVTDYPAFLRKSGYEERISSPVQVNPFFSALIVSDIDAAIHWYTDVFSLKLHNKTENRERGFKQANMGNDDMLIELVELKSSRSRKEVEQQGSRVAGYYKLGFAVSDFDAWHQKLKVKGVEFFGRTVTDVVSGKRTFLVKDVDGNTIQFFEG